MSKLRPADSINIGFNLYLLAVVAFFSSAIPLAGNLAVLYGSLILFQLLLVPLSRVNPFLRLCREIIFPVVSVLVIFDSLGLIVHSVNPQDMDYFLIRLDYRIFGCYPTVFLERIMHPLLTDLLQLAYTTYYFLPIALGVTLKLRGREEELNRTLFLILLCFYLSYVGYILVPAVGPRYAMEHLQTRELGGLFLAGPIQDTLNLLEGVKRDAFPSGHTGIALTVLFLAWRYERRLFRIMLAPVLLLITATVYCRYHYGVDVIGGVILALVTILLGEVYYMFWFRRRHGDPSQ